MKFVELARPTTMGQMVGLDDLKADVNSWYSHEYQTGQSTLPQALLFHGPPGTGKTSAAYVIARTFLGDDFNTMNFIESNASDDRGIDFIRGSFKTAMRTKGIGVDGRRKIILLDEADGLTPAAQDAMRQLIEKYAHNAMVILTCNEIEKIRPAIRSRCSIYTFTPVSPEAGAERLFSLLHNTLDDIALKETGDVGFPNQQAHTFEKLIKLMNGDMRATIMFLDSIDLADLEERVNMLEASSAEDSIAYAINNGFYSNIYSHFEDEDTLDMIWDIMVVYGDSMTHRYTWPGDDYSFLDWMVSKMRKQVNRGNEI